MSTTNDTTSSSDNVHTTPTSTTTTSLSPTWAPPKAPLPPHRLAKLANALGVSTPVPIYHRKDRTDRSPSPYLVPSPVSALSLNTPDAYASIRETYASLRRSPTPSSAGSVTNSGTPYTFTSKFLLHVIPPIYLPHHSQLRDNVASGSGYHSQFRRGTLVAVHPTFQAQLWAIAKEYALPSITGIVLYIVSPSQSAQDQTTPTGAEDGDEPGPRLSEEIWRHLWTRVWKAEREELPPMLASLGLPGPVTSPPFLAIDSGTPVSPLRPFLTAAGTNSDTALNQMGSYSSPSTPSSASTLAFLRSRSPTSEVPDNDTPPTSHSNSLDSTDVDSNLFRANSLPLPGLSSPSLMPILAKVEFDIDRRNAAWYEPWAKRRRVKKKKKKAKSDTTGNDLPKRLKLTGKARTGSPGSAFSWKDQGASGQLVDDEEDEEDDEDDIGDEDETARVLSTSGSDLKVPHSRRRNVHDLTFDDDDDSESEDGGIEQSELTRGAEEISEIMAQMGQKPSRSNSLSKKRIPPPLVLHPAGGAASKELKVPSPLNSATFTPPGSSSSSGSTSLPYLKGIHDGRGRYIKDPEGFELLEDEIEGYRTKSPLETEKRTGGVYDDLDLDLGELDDDDLHDRRRSQLIFKAKLDEIERNLAQLSPRALKSDLEDDQFAHNIHLSSPKSPFLGVPVGRQDTPILMNSDILPPTPSTGGFNESPTRPRKGSSAASSPSRAQWPAVPFSTLTGEDEDAPGPSRRSRAESRASPPRLAINGVSTFAPHAFKRQNSLSSSSDISAETMKRRKEAEEEQNLYPALNLLSQSGSGSENSSPVIPLSPDPFGRFSSTPDPSEGPRQSVKVWNKVPVGGSVEQLSQDSQRKRTTSISDASINEVPPRNSETSSRFSVDSSKDNIEVPASISKTLSGSSVASAGSAKEKSGNRTTVMSMKGIKKLWRKSNKTSVSIAGPPSPIPESPMFPPRPSADEPLKSPSVPSLPSTRAPSPQSLQNLPQASAAPTRPTRPLKEELDIPDIPDQLAIPLQPANGRPAPMPIIAAQMQAGLHLRSSVNGDRMQFDQESPYPMPSRKPQQRKMSLSTNGAHPPPQLPSRTPSPASSAGGSIGAAAGASMTGESRQANVRRSILKWKAAAAVHQIGEQTNSNGASSRSSSERITSNGTVRPRAPSFSHGSHRSSISVADIPPSPKIPEHFLASRAPSEHLRTGSHLTNSSTDSRLTTVTDISSFQSLNSPSSSQTSHGSPPSNLQTDLARNSSLDSNAKLSMDPGGPRKTSFDSQSDRRTTDDDDAYSDSRPSIDSSQFEMVSPKMEVGTLTYPYTTVGMHQ
ncbi:hypothetical protein F5890DRAFT_1488290 [Lentinula detonsa]|uniref:Proteophosphoglycan ppg4 n=1 Tax=Lentinula detonsa TaxID=2804962 RepID=A0AA38Q7Y9_9AGAR|nr:hypothetical protein F5890DRAFT_1488290 [Lentinula detonsa]